MDKEEIKNSIIERFNSLQPEIQEAIMDSNYENNIYEVGKKYNLNIEQLGELEFNTTLVMLGQTHPDDYNKELIDDLKISEDKINEIVKDVNEKVLNPILILLKKNFEDDDRIESELEEVPVPPYSETNKKEEVEENEKNIEQAEPLENEQKSISVPKNIFEEKLSTPTTSSHIVSDHSTTPKENLPPKNNTLNSSQKSSDPYREEF